MKSNQELQKAKCAYTFKMLESENILLVLTELLMAVNQTSKIRDYDQFTTQIEIESL